MRFFLRKILNHLITIRYGPAKKRLEVGWEGFKYSPELNPAERVFEEVRGHIEGEVYPSLEAKRKAIDHLLRQLRADKTRLRRLVGWDWLQQALVQLPNADSRGI